MCDELVNSCEADQTARNTCATAQAAADTKAAKTGAQADAFNAVFGIITDFAAVASVDDQGNVIAGTGSESSAADNVATTKVCFIFRMPWTVMELTFPVNHLDGCCEHSVSCSNGESYVSKC